MKKHPAGLYVLFATEMWERFSFYFDAGSLHAGHPTRPCLYSTYMMFVYMSPSGSTRSGGRRASLRRGLASKVGPYRFRGLLMGGWFVATAIGNKLTAIGNYWDDWKHSTFFAVLGAMAFVMAVVLALLIRPLKRAMPGV